MKYKVILSGYEGSKQILPASSYLLKKYLPRFNIYFLNYGKYDGKLFIGEYVELADKQEGGSSSWSRDIKKYLETLRDKYVIFALDDYLISHPIDMKLYNRVDMAGVGCCNLCSDSDIKDKAYTCTTQYTIWDRKLLIEILSLVITPWQFEKYGSLILNGMFKHIAHTPAMTYPANSCLSTKWNGVRLDGNEHDEKEIRKLL